MKKIDRYLKRKKIFLVSFLTSFLVCFVFTVFASSFIFKEGAEQMREEGFVIGYVYEDRGNESYDNAVAVTKGKTSAGNAADNGALTIVYDDNGTFTETDKNAAATVEEKTYTFTSRSSAAEEINACVITFLDTDGSLIMESTFGAGDTLVFPYLSSEKAVRIIDGVTYTATWGDVEMTVTSDATYVLSYVIQAD